MKVNCPSCGQEYNIDDSRAGKVVQCAGCSDCFEIPKLEEKKNPVPAIIDVAPPPKDQGQKNCPMCGERILYIAKKCRYCGSMLDGENVHEEINFIVYVLLGLFAGIIGIHNLYAGQYARFVLHVAFLLASVFLILTPEPSFAILPFAMNWLMAITDLINDPNKKIKTKTKK